MNKGELNILIVDDDRDDILLAQSLLRDGLKAIALELDVAESFSEGLSRLEQSRYGLLFFDYQLGEKNGLELMKDIRRQGIDTPVVFLTGRGDEEIAVEAMKLGASDYLPKSKLSETLVRAAVRHAIELHEKERLRQGMESDLRKINRELEGWVKELERRSRESTLLNEVGNALQTCMTVEEAYALIAQRISEFFPGRSGGLCISDASRKIVEAVAVWGEHPPENREFTINECWALRRTRLYSVCGHGTAIPCPHLEGTPWKSQLCVPMMAYGETLGLLMLEGSGPAEDACDERKRRAWQSAYYQFAETLSEQLALALANLKLREALRNEAMRDSLTGLFSRRYMEEFLQRAVSSAQRHNRHLALLILDIDHFKQFNDVYGHEAGDTLLRFLGDFLHTRTRGEDIACRYGGDEFVLILPEVTLNVAAQRADQLRLTFRSAPRSGDFPWSSPPTISVGVSAAPQHGFSA